MPISNEASSNDPSTFKVTPTGSGFEVRRANALDIRDPFVRVSSWDGLGNPSITGFRVHGVQRFSDYDTLGTNSVDTVGDEVRIEVTTPLIVDDDRKAEIAGKLAALTFEISEVGANE